MADQTLIFNDLAGNRSLPVKLVDLGDGTYALSTTLGASPSIDIGDVTLLAGTALVGKVGIDQTTPGTTNKVIASGLPYTSQVSVTRPANTTPYTAGDVVGATAAAVELTNIGPANGSIMLTSADLMLYLAAVPSGMTSFRAHLYNATPPSALADNAAFDIPAGDRASYLGYVDMGTPVDVGSSLFVQTPTDFRKQFLLGASTSLWAYFVTLAGYTPGSADVMVARFHAVGI